VWTVTHAVYYGSRCDSTAQGSTMEYARFEKLVIGLGAAAVVGNTLVSLAGAGWSGWQNAVVGLLLLPVLVVAVHSGRTSGMVAALAASAALMLIKAPVLSAPAGVPLKEFAVIAVNVLAFGVVGIVGGEFCSRLKYVFARSDRSLAIDDWSNVYNQRRAWELIRKARERHSRYGESFAIVELSDTPAVFAGLRPARQRALVRAVAGYLRGNVRLIDEVARLDDGRFLVVLPHTGRDGGGIVAERLLSGVAQTLDVAEDAIGVRCLTAADELELTSLAASIAPPEGAQERSGE